MVNVLEVELETEVSVNNVGNEMNRALGHLCAHIG